MAPKLLEACLAQALAVLAEYVDHPDPKLRERARTYVQGRAG
jgi:hypothetical protein